MNITTEQKNLLKPFEASAYELYAEAQAIKENLKDLVEAAAEKTGLDKTVVSTRFQIRYKDDLAEREEKIEIQKFLAE